MFNFLVWGVGYLFLQKLYRSLIMPLVEILQLVQGQLAEMLYEHSAGDGIKALSSIRFGPVQWTRDSIGQNYPYSAGDQLLVSGDFSVNFGKFQPLLTCIL